MNMVHRLYVEKKNNLEAKALLEDIRTFLQITRLTDLRMINRYDVEWAHRPAAAGPACEEGPGSAESGMNEALLASCVSTVFSEPPLDRVYDALPSTDGIVFAVEYLPGQFDQRADSAAQCVQLVSMGERPLVATAKLYILSGPVTEADVEAIKRYVINPVESREAGLEKPATLALPYDIPTAVPTLDGFIGMDAQALASLRAFYGLAMDEADLSFCQQYFISERRDPTLTELRMIDTYWSDHCRHTTFLTEITGVSFDDERAQATYERYLALRETLGIEKPITLMDLATIGVKALRREGLLLDLDESAEINACTVRIEAIVDGKPEPWLLLFKNETHNHPTEIEPFGGAATCIGGAIRDPLSGRAYVYQAMRVTGSADPLRPVGETLPGKLPQRKLTTTAAAGYSAYGNQIGLATGLVDELYHPGYAAKRMEIGAVVGAAPASHVRREEPTPGDIVVLLGGRTGRDGCGGATGSSKSHTSSSLTQCGAEVQKGNAPEERKLQRLFRSPEATRLIKRCNDFGAGGVSVAIGELADGLWIDLNAVPRKYEGLDGTELAISESQERMAVVLAPEDVKRFQQLADEENLEATVVARVTEAPRLVMEWNGRAIVDIGRDFLNSNGAPKQATAFVPKPFIVPSPAPASFEEGMRGLAQDLNICSRRGLAERFDATIGAATVLMPFGGIHQLTPPQAMVAKLPLTQGETTTCSAMAYGFNPYLTEQDPYRGAYLAVVESVAKLVATGAGYKKAHLTFQEYFERMTPVSFGKPLSALLGALQAQLDLGLAAIGGKDSMSGSFESMHVPPTLVSFAVTVADTGDIISPEFKRPGSRVALVTPGDTPQSQLDAFDLVTRLVQEKKVSACYAIGAGGIAEALLKMCLGNRIGFAFDLQFSPMDAFPLQPGPISGDKCAGIHNSSHLYGSFLLETDAPVGITVGQTTEDFLLHANDVSISISELAALWSDKLDPVFKTKTPGIAGATTTYHYKAEGRVKPRATVARPRALIPVFPGTNCEYDTARALERAGAAPEVFVINNLTPQGVEASAARFAKLLEEVQILFLPGGFSGGDEPDGSGKFITAFLRSPRIADSIGGLLSLRGGLIGGICNGFQALIKLGLLPYGEIRTQDADAPTLTYNAIGRHQSRLVRARVASNKSPWLMHAEPGDIYLAAISHGEGRFICGDAMLAELSENGQIATQYVDLHGNATMDILFNPNGSAHAVEGITSPDGRVFGRMAHVERAGSDLFKNVPGNTDCPMFRGAVDYFG